MIKKLIQENKFKEAFDLALKEAKNNNSEAYYLLGQLYMQGLGTKANPSEAYKWFSRSNDIRAYYNLGIAHELGIGTYKDEKKAFEYYNRASELDEGKYSMALCFFDGVGVEKNVTLALNLIETLVDKGFNQAKLFMANIYEDGEVLEKDEKKAFEYYTELANCGLYERYLANCYQNGIGVSIDKKKAFDLYQTAALKDDFEAMYQLACIYDYGWGVEENKQSAFEWYLKAASFGHPMALHNAGISYIYGEGVEKNCHQGCLLLDKAMKLGCTEAKDMLKNFKFSHGKWTPKN